MVTDAFLENSFPRKSPDLGPWMALNCKNMNWNAISEYLPEPDCTHNSMMWCLDIGSRTVAAGPSRRIFRRGHVLSVVDWKIRDSALRMAAFSVNLTNQSEQLHVFLILFIYTDQEEDAYWHGYSGPRTLTGDVFTLLKGGGMHPVAL
jgi:hypothetical protein